MFLVCVALQPERVQAQISTPPVVQVAGFATCLSLKLCPSAEPVFLVSLYVQFLRVHLRVWIAGDVQVAGVVVVHALIA